MSWLVGFLFWAGLAICFVCVVMANGCYAVMFEQLNRRLPEGQKLERPFLSYKWAAIVSLHEELCPESQVRAELRLLKRVLVLTFGSIAFVMLAWVISKGPAQR